MAQYLVSYSSEVGTRTERDVRTEAANIHFQRPVAVSTLRDRKKSEDIRKELESNNITDREIYEACINSV
jgi:hypothetical protein